jgi:hypothetical protein
MNIAKPSGDGIAHFAHLGGMIFGFIYLKKDRFVFKAHNTMNDFVPWQEKKEESRPLQPLKKERNEEMRAKVDAILDKINEVGYERLSQEEKDILLEASQHLSTEDKSKVKH